MTRQSELGGDDQIGLGIHGLGVAGALMLGAALTHRQVRVAGVSDLRLSQLPLQRLPSSCRRYEDLDHLLQDDEVDVVYIATPTSCHFLDAQQVLAAGRSAVVEKPFTADLESAATLVELAVSPNQVLLVGHSRSFDPDVQAVAHLVQTGVVGRVEFIAATHFSAWLRRPRLADEFDSSLGGGIINRQAVHQIDTVRLILGGDALQVVAVHHRNDQGLDTVGSYLAWLESSAGVSVTMLMDGTGGFLDGGERPIRTAATNESDRKRHMSDAILSAALAGDSQPVRSNDHDHEDVVVIGTDGEIRATNGSVVISSSTGRRPVSLEGFAGGRTAVLDELVAGLVDARPLHDAKWGYENMRICEALASRRSPWTS